MSTCCFIHGCEFQPNPHKNPVCGGRSANWMSASPLRSRDLKRKPKPKFWLRLNHYSRSVEKFTVKLQSWTETVNAVSNNAYLHRGYTGNYDPVALVYSCMVRAEINRARQLYALKKKNGSLGGSSSDLDNSDSVKPSFEFLRQGKYWARNPEFGRERLVVMEEDVYNLTSPGLKFPRNPATYAIMVAESSKIRSNDLFVDYYGL
jgi:hypothetical protein